jgi:hypothetical protein
MASEAVAVLERARELISEPEHRTKGSYARTANGMGTSPRASGAVCWCMIGAVIREAGDSALAGDTLALLLKVIPTKSAAVFNDTSTHADVLAAFDKAIALGRGEEA